MNADTRQLPLDFDQPATTTQPPEQAEFERWLSTFDGDQTPFEEWEIEALRRDLSHAEFDLMNTMVVHREYARLGPKHRPGYFPDEANWKAAFDLYMRLPAEAETRVREAKLKYDYAVAHRAPTRAKEELTNERRI